MSWTTEEAERLHRIHCREGCSEYGGRHDPGSRVEEDIRPAPPPHEHTPECFEC